jgi:soluble lytic murein transglycosylase-like protein
MRNCSIFAGTVLLGLGTLGAATVERPVRKATVVVRTDARSGHLVRRVVVTPRAVREKVIRPVPVSSSKPSTQPEMFAADSQVDRLIEEAARKHQVDPLLVHSVIRVESNYDPFAISPKGAEGLMQLLPSTARRFGVSNTFNVGENIDAGVRYLKYLQDLFKDDRLALAAYNAGEAAVAKYNSIPPYWETRNYVYQVGKTLGELREWAKKTRTAEKESAERQYRPLEHFIDAEGRFHLRTR